MEREKERQERVLMGLEPPPPPKVKISNLMRVLGAEATADPTQIEQEVRKQMAERVSAHEARNQARKLTKEEKKEKKKKKFEKDLKLGGTYVALFRIADLSDPKHRFKVDANARNFQLTGCAILYKDVNMVVVEGGQKAIKKFKKLLLKRIDWNKTVNEEEKDTNHKENKQENSCELIWEGTILKPNFQQFRFETMTSEEQIRKYLNHRWSEHYWDMIKTAPKEEIF
jgi:U4/U6 small nuclear ribonucleoprotein PRP3